MNGMGYGHYHGGHCHGLSRITVTQVMHMMTPSKIMEGGKRGAESQRKGVELEQSPKKSRGWFSWLKRPTAEPSYQSINTQ